MLRGCQKQVVVLRGKSGDIFEEAYFILRAGGSPTGLPELLCEANRIVESTKNCASEKKAASTHMWRFVFFLFGLLTGVGVVLLSVAVT